MNFKRFITWGAWPSVVSLDSIITSGCNEGWYPSAVHGFHGNTARFNLSWPTNHCWYTVCAFPGWCFFTTETALYRHQAKSSRWTVVRWVENDGVALIPNSSTCQLSNVSIVLNHTISVVTDTGYAFAIWLHMRSKVHSCCVPPNEEWFVRFTARSMKSSAASSVSSSTASIRLR